MSTIPFCWIEVTLLPIVTEVKLVQPENAALPILVTPLLIITVWISVRKSSQGKEEDIICPVPLMVSVPLLNVAITFVAMEYPMFHVCVTVTVHCAVKLPSWVAAVIIVVPGANAVIKPSVTVATVGTEEIHDTILLVAFSGKTVAVSCSASRTKIDTVDFKFIPVTEILEPPIGNIHEIVFQLAAAL